MSNSTRNYLKDFDYRAHAHTASASQLSTYLTCPRKWWFQKALRMPEVEQQSKFEFGNRLHEACERYLLSDDNGNDLATGKPVEMWPEGWDAGISAQEAGILKQIVQLGIDEGILRRTPGREIEKPFFFTLAPGVGVCGYRDVAAPGLVEDHKSIKRRRYKATQQDLREDPQLLLYAAVDIRERMADGYKPDRDDKITLRHNQFIKDPDDLFVQACETEVTVGEVMDFVANEIEPAATQMLELKQKKLPGKAWKEVEGPRVANACREYGGCQFAEVCGGSLTTEALRARIERINELPTEDQDTATTKTATGGSMGIFDRKKQRETSFAITEEAAPPTPAKTRKPKPKKVEEPAPNEAAPAAETVEVSSPSGTSDKTVPPWAVEDCRACEGVGFVAGEPCAACDREADAKGAVPSSAFDIRVDDDGYTVWEIAGVQVGRRRLTAEPKAGDDTKPRAESTTPGKQRRKPGRPRKEAAEPKDVEAEATIEGPSREIEQIVRIKPGRGRPAMGWFLIYGAVRRSKFPMVDLNQVFHQYAAQLAEKMGAASYYDLDRFKRSDLMKAHAEEIAGFIKAGSMVTVRADDRDIKAFAAAIEPYATVVIEGNG